MAIRIPRHLFGIIALVGFVGQACSLGGLAAGGQATVAPASPTGGPVVPTDTVPPPTETALPVTPTVVHLAQPGEVPSEQYFLSDVSSSGTNQAQRALAGDNYYRNRLERPFSVPSMDYRADLDITRVEIKRMKPGSTSPSFSMT
jgi:hypothetical protein